MDRKQQLVVQKGLELFRLMGEEPPGIFDRRHWAGELMRLAMERPELKVRLFRFIDVLPSLTSDEMVANHLREYFLADGLELPPLLQTLLAGATSRLTAGVTAAMVKKNFTAVAHTFIAGATLTEALPALSGIWDEGRGFTVDILGEAALSELEEKRYLDGYLALAEGLGRELAGWPVRDQLRERTFPRLNISVKLSSLYARVGPLNYEDSVVQLKERLRPLCRAVRAAGGFVNFDMEMVALKNITLDVFTELLSEPEFRDWEDAGVAVQAYLMETRQDLERLIGWARTNRRRITVRLVKGAYWEYEQVMARQNGWPLPVFSNKGHTDWNFERCVELLFAGNAHVTPALATHNVRSLAHALVTAERLGVAPERFEFQMLYGMAEPVKQAVQRLGFPVREYVPIGPLIPGMAYLVRRLLENTSNEGFLRKSFSRKVPPEELLAEPEPWPGEAPQPVVTGIAPFANEPAVDLSVKANRLTYRQAIARVRGELGKDYPLVLGGKEQRTDIIITSLNPARPGEVVGRVAGLTLQLVDRAVAAAHVAQTEWGKRPAAERATLLFRAAEIARRRKYELMAWEILETGKNWGEADADVAEAIDYFEYYGREMLRLGEPLRLGDIPGEENRYFYQPRGVALVIAPWNFPLAISAGMVAAALVAGNSVLYKPSSLSAVTGWQLYAILQEAGLPPGVLSFIPGRGEMVGNALVEHPAVNLIAFTGSRQVGLGIVASAGRTGAGQRGVKKVVAEMGGKNAIIVDADADLDQAVAGVIQSAFGYQGEKCSACSRVLVLASCYDRFLQRLVEAVRGITVGPPEDPTFFMGPLIEERAVERLQGYLELAHREGKVAVVGSAPAGAFYSPPGLVTDLPRDSRILREELFGPLLAVTRVNDIAEALTLANDSDYALTGGLYSRSPAAIARVAAEFAVGNLYLNRAITGAMVGRQPFGGFRLSGVGSKAGGPDYLLQFMEPRVVTENTLRRGFTPEVIA